MSQRLSFIENFGVTAMITGTTTHYIADLEPSGIQQSAAPLYQFAYFGFSTSAASGNWGMRIMAVMPDGILRSIAGVTARGTGTNHTFSIDANNGNTSWPGVPRPTAIEYTRATGASGNLFATVYGTLYTP